MNGRPLFIEMTRNKIDLSHVDKSNDEAANVINVDDVDVIVININDNGNVDAT